jgi:hypothetical protein
VATNSICSIPDCGKPVKGRGWCIAHYARYYRHGNPLAGRTPDGEPRRYLTEVVIPFRGDDCLMWPYSRSSDGYGQVCLNNKTRIASRVVCEAVHGTPPTVAHEAAHSCGNGHLACVNPDHLTWKTPLDNQSDKRSHGTRPIGELSGTAKITASDVLKIRAMAFTNSRRDIAERFQISVPTVGDIIRRKTWAHIVEVGVPFVVRRRKPLLRHTSVI